MTRQPSWREAVGPERADRRGSEEWAAAQQRGAAEVRSRCRLLQGSFAAAAAALRSSGPRAGSAAPAPQQLAQHALAAPTLQPQAPRREFGSRRWDADKEREGWRGGSGNVPPSPGSGGNAGGPGCAPCTLGRLLLGPAEALPCVSWAAPPGARCAARPGASPAPAPPLAPLRRPLAHRQLRPRPGPARQLRARGQRAQRAARRALGGGAARRARRAGRAPRRPGWRPRWQ
jgi:hypothetical protein